VQPHFHAGYGYGAHVPSYGLGYLDDYAGGFPGLQHGMGGLDMGGYGYGYPY
jgi:hypothetical protein